MSTIRIAQAQINPTVGDLQGNAELIASAVDQARQQGAHVVTFPECALSGYPPEDLLLKPHFMRDCRDALEMIARQSDGIVVVVGFPDALDDKVYNAAGVICNSRLLGVYHKIELPNYGVFDERRYFAAGAECPVFDLHGAPMAVTICEDIWLPGNSIEQGIRDNRVRVVLNISGSPFHAGKLAQRREIAEGFARRTSAYLCYNNLVGGQDELVFDGGSLVVDPQGQLVASAKRFKPDMLVTDIELDAFHAPNAAQAKRIALEPDKADAAHNAAPCRAAELGRVEEIRQALVLGVRDYVHKNGFGQVVLGLSGGIDSSLTACIATAALGKDNVVGVTMPSQYTSSETQSDAGLLAENLGIRFLTVPVRNIFTAYLDELAQAFGDGEPGLECENLQARIRGNILMALSNRFGWLVLCSGNKSETAVGYCTLYGDTCGALAVIKDVPKMLVYELSEHINRKAGRDIIPRSVIVRPPTAELRPNQKDEDSLLPYPMLDPILRAYVEEDKAPDDIASQGFRTGMVDEVVRLVHRSEYKRRQTPPGIKITPKAFGRDRRLPITNRYGI